MQQVELIPADGQVLKYAKISLNGSTLARIRKAPFIWKAEDFSELSNLGFGKHTLLASVKNKDGLVAKQEITIEIKDGSIFDPRIPQYDSRAVHGVWDRSGLEDNYGVFRGRNSGNSWAEIEPKQGKFNWAPLEDQIKEALERDQYVYFKVNVGPVSPDWIYSAGVPKVLTDSNRFPHYPYYLDKNYEKYVINMINKLGKRVRSAAPQEWKDRLVFIQPVTGCTGDEVPYKGNPLKAYKQYSLHRHSSNGTNIERKFLKHLSIIFKNQMI